MRLLAILIVVVALSPRAWAQNGPSATDRKNAEKYFLEATKAYDAKNYAEAIPGFLAAYQLVPNTQILFTLGQACRLAGEKEKAIAYYEKYVGFEPNGAAVAEAKEHIVALRLGVAEDKKKADADAARAADEAARASAAEEQKRRDAQAAKLAQARSEAAQKGSGLRTGGIVVGLIGVVGVGVGIALLASDKTTPGAIATGAGGAGLVAGGVMYFMGAKQRSDAEAALPSAALVPTIGPHTAGIAFIASF